MYRFRDIAVCSRSKDTCCQVLAALYDGGGTMQSAALRLVTCFCSGVSHSLPSVGRSSLAPDLASSLFRHHFALKGRAFLMIIFMCPLLHFHMDNACAGPIAAPAIQAQGIRCILGSGCKGNIRISRSRGAVGPT